ncbi:DUF2306 domain-containing protein [Ferrovibrio sp.]|uniref:DUF2306 domain-containing protein n=1 Tax=Ferrovibrio sp. TaxID=1917215 RepID=UPI0025C03255|nr:DUF2306 domain-containing protein [Ferrovibrio sp.]MBX3453348.1 DUF2306 domain-containing protein [Ferrovibrio sp.]
MNIAPILAASLAVKIHLFATILALALGCIILLRAKGTFWHKRLGWAFALAMLTAALSSFFITSDGHFSLIHILSVVVLISLPYGLVQARRGRLRAHRATMLSLYGTGLVLTGIFTLIPGRLLGRVFFGW